MITCLSLLYGIGTLILTLIVYAAYNYIIRPYFLLQFYKKQGAEIYFCPIVGDSLKNIENIEKHGDVWYDYKQKALQNPKPKLWAFNFGARAHVILKDHELVRNFFLNHDQFYTKLVSVITLVKTLTGDGILLSDGAVWKRHRKLVSAAFSFDFLKEMIPEIVDIADELLEKIKNRKDLTKFDMLSETHHITGEIVGRIFLGSNFGDYQLHGESITQCLIDLLVECAAEDQTALSSMLGENLIRKGIFPQHKRVLNKIKEFRAAVRNIAVQNMKSLDQAEQEAATERKRVSIIELFNKQRKQNPQEALTEEELVDEFITFFIAGSETTGHVLTMASYFFMKNPHIQDKVFEEVEKCFSDISNISFDNLNKMEYLTAFIKETLRMSPIAGVLFERVAKIDHDLGGLYIKKGTVVNVSFLSNYFDPDYHTDPYTFRPERWLEDSKTKESVGKNPYVYTPFSAGTRNCLGQHLAMNEAKIILSLFLKKFRYELTDKDYVLRMTERSLYEPFETIYYKLHAK